MAKRGRPTNYKPEYCDEILEFFSRDCFENVKGKHRARKLPTLVEFAKNIKVGISTVYDWIDPQHNSYQKAFSDTYRNKVHELQKNVLIQGGLLGYYNPMFCKFVATNLTDMKEAPAIDFGEGTQILVIRSGKQLEGQEPEQTNNQTKAISG